jgi:5-methylcytosine-specific restriction endonuclease McrA
MPTPQERAEYNRAWYLANREKELEKKRRERVERAEVMRARDRAKYLKFREKNLARQAEYRRKHPERVNRANRNWYAKNRDTAGPAVDARSVARRALKKSSGVRISAKAWREIKDAYGHRCAYCGVSGVTMTREHVDPLTLGGQHIPENLVPACKPCNSAKQDRTILAWLAGIPPARFHRRLHAARYSVER